MSIWEYFLVGLRHKFFIISLTILLTVMGYLAAAWKIKPTYITTIFLSIAPSSENVSQQSSALENLQSADLFAETLQGWFRNPYFLKQIETKAGLSTSLSAKKQEKQNLIISFEIESQEKAQKVQEAIGQTLRTELDLYNSASSTDFSFAILNAESSLKKPNIALYVFISFIFALLISYLTIYLYERKQNFLMSKKEVYKIFKAYPFFEWNNIKDFQRERSKFISFLQTFYKDQEIQVLFFSPKLQEVFMGTLKDKKDLKKKLKSIVFPEDLNLLNSSSPLILISQLGKTSLADLERVKKLDLLRTELILLH